MKSGLRLRAGDPLMDYLPGVLLDLSEAFDSGTPALKAQIGPAYPQFESLVKWLQTYGEICCDPGKSVLYYKLMRRHRAAAGLLLL